jgi:hypothetical protein
VTRKNIEEAVREAYRFIKQAETVRRKHYRPDAHDSSLFFASKETAALKRASMDLTRSLAERRKP